MSLFEVKGWDAPTQAGIVGSAARSKKRKRSASDAGRVQSAQVNVEKLMRKVEKGVIRSRNEQKKGQRNQRRAEVTHSMETSGDYQTKSPGEEARVKVQTQKKKNRKGETTSKVMNSSNTIKTSPSKRARKSSSGISLSSHLKHDMDDAPSPDQRKAGRSTEPPSGLTSLQASMKGSLDGARFRCSSSSRPIVF